MKKQISIDEEVWVDLTRLKLEWRSEMLSDVIKRLIKSEKESHSK